MNPRPKAAALHNWSSWARSGLGELHGSRSQALRKKKCHRLVKPRFQVGMVVKHFRQRRKIQRVNSGFCLSDDRGAGRVALNERHLAAYVARSKPGDGGA